MSTCPCQQRLHASSLLQSGGLCKHSHQVRLRCLQVYGEIEFECNHWSVFENAIDMAHIHYLHNDTFGNQVGGVQVMRPAPCIASHEPRTTFVLCRCCVKACIFKIAFSCVSTSAFVVFRNPVGTFSRG